MDLFDEALLSRFLFDYSNFDGWSIGVERGLFPNSTCSYYKHMSCTCTCSLPGPRYLYQQPFEKNLASWNQTCNRKESLYWICLPRQSHPWMVSDRLLLVLRSTCAVSPCYSSVSVLTNQLDQDTITTLSGSPWPYTTSRFRRIRIFGLMTSYQSSVFAPRYRSTSFL